MSDYSFNSTDEISSLSDSQEKTLSLLSAISGCISICGSSLIIFRVVFNRHHSNPYERIMFGLSCCDIITSLSFALSPFLVPQGDGRRVWAIGNTATCNFLGFLTQLAFSSVMYNGVLSYYYLLTVRFGCRREVFARKYERWMHLATISFFLITAASGNIVGFYDELELGMGCWVGDYPTGCEEDQSCISHYIGWVIGAVPFIFVVFSLPVNNLIIYYYVRNTLGKEVRREMSSTSALPSIRTLRHIEHIREVAWQGTLYVGTFYLSYLVAFIVKAVEAFDVDASREADIYPLLVLNSFLPPLQGLFNALVYIRPNYVRVRAANPEEPRRWALKRALLEADIPRLTESRMLTNHDKTSKSNTSNSKLNTGAGGNALAILKGKSSRSRSSGKFNSDLADIPEASHEEPSSELMVADASRETCWRKFSRLETIAGQQSEGEPRADSLASQQSEYFPHPKQNPPDSDPPEEGYKTSEPEESNSEEEALELEENWIPAGKRMVMDGSIL